MYRGVIFTQSVIHSTLEVNFKLQSLVFITILKIILKVRMSVPAVNEQTEDLEIVKLEQPQLWHRNKTWVGGQ